MINSLRIKAYVGELNSIVEVLEIDFVNKVVLVEYKGLEEIYYTFEEIKILESTKLKDLNNSEIFQDDIVKVYYSYPYNAKTYIVDVTNNGVILKSTDTITCQNGTKMCDSFLHLNKKRLSVTEVIGNTNIKGD